MNSLLNLVICVIIFSSIYSCSFALQDKKNESFKSAQITMGKSGQAPTQIRFPVGKEVAVSSFWNGYSIKFNLSKDDEFKIFRTISDKTGQTHHRYKQYYKGIEVADMQYILHEKNGRVHLANGKIIHGLNIDIKPSLSKSQALEKALSHLGIQGKSRGKSTKQKSGKTRQDKNTVDYSKGKLLISSTGEKVNAENFSLAYRFEIYSELPSFAYSVDVNAHTGEILNKVSLILNSGVQDNK